MVRESIRIGKLTVVFDGSKIWTEKARINLRDQIKWLNSSNIDNYLDFNISIVYKQSKVELFEISDTKDSIKLVFGIDKWYKANSSIMFQIIAILSDSVLVHGNCIIDKQSRKAHVFTAHGGVGKTSMLLEALYKGDGRYDFGGDDLVWLSSRNITALPYYRPMCIYDYHYRTFSDVFNNLNIRFRSPSIFYRAVNLFMINFRAVLGENFLTDYYSQLSIVPRSRYFLLDPINFFDLSQSGSIDIGSVAYLENADSFEQIEVEKSALMSLALNSTLREFKEYAKILDELCFYRYKCSFSKHTERVLNIILEKQNKHYKISTSGKWDILEIEQTLVQD